MILHLDFETKSNVDLPKKGAYVYARHHSTDILLAGYAFGSEPVEVWDAVHARIPADLHDALINPDCRIVAYNAQFERLICQAVLQLEIPNERF